MSITQITEREQQLTHYLAEMTKALELMRQERDANARLFLEDIKTLEAERDALKAELGDLPESQAAMLRENKVLRDALAPLLAHSEPMEKRMAYTAERAGEVGAIYAAARAALTRSKS